MATPAESLCTILCPYCGKSLGDVERIHALAAQGNADTQCILSWYYTNGKGVEQSATETVKWYCKQDNEVAQYNLALCYAKDTGVEQSWMEAVMWFRKAAERGYASAQYDLGWCYANGEGVEQSWTETLKWLRRAAQGDENVKFALEDTLRRLDQM